MKEVKAAARLEPWFAEVQYQYGLILYAVGRLPEAIVALGASVRSKPRFMVARIALASFLCTRRAIGRPLSQLERSAAVMEQGRMAVDGAAGLKLATEGDHDVMVLDVMLPKLSGLDVCKRVRTENFAAYMLEVKTDRQWCRRQS